VMISNLPCLWYIIYTITYLVDYLQIEELISLCLDINNCITTGEPVNPARGVTPRCADLAISCPKLDDDVKP
jgi:hypothetical protein